MSENAPTRWVYNGHHFVEVPVIETGKKLAVHPEAARHAQSLDYMVTGHAPPARTLEEAREMEEAKLAREVERAEKTCAAWRAKLELVREASAVSHAPLPLKADPRTGWLAELKEGDKVYVERYGNMGTSSVLYEVDKITPTGKIRIGHWLFTHRGTYQSYRLKPHPPQETK